jgi:hypothetical protein
MAVILRVQAVLSATGEIYKFPRLDSGTQSITLKDTNVRPERGGYPGIVTAVGTTPLLLKMNEQTENTVGFLWMQNTSTNPALWVRWGPSNLAGSTSLPAGIIRPGEPCLFRLKAAIEALKFEIVGDGVYTPVGSDEVALQIYIFDE